MKKLVSIPVVIILIGLGLFWGYNQLREPQRSREVNQNQNQIAQMKLESSVFENGGSIPAKYTCDGENINPPFRWSDVPEGTVSLVLIMDDPDVPKSVKPDGMWDHWLIWDIPPETLEIREGEAPMGTLGKNTGGSFGYQGPCPPDREHRYFFKLYALDKELGLPRETAAKKDLEVGMNGHILAQAELMGRYDRAK